MTTKNAAPSLQAEEAVAAKRERYVRSVASDLWGCQSKDATSVVDSRALDAAVRLLNEHAEALATIATLRAALPTWIPVEERLPEPCEEGSAIGITASYIVLTASVDGVIGTGWVDYLDDPPVWRGCIDPETFEPTHWMNLPEPPK